MNPSARGVAPRLRWGAILAGAAIAVATGWTGELFGSLLSLIEPGESSAWGWLGGIVSAGLWVVGSLVGGYVAARVAGSTVRMNGMLHGLVVWGVVGTASALLFAVLGGNLGLVAGATAGAIRLAIGFAMISLLGSLLAAAAGGALATEAGARPLRRRIRGAEERPPTWTEGRPEEPEAWSEPTERGPGGPVPPSVH